MSLTKVQVKGTLLGFKSGAAVETHDIGFTTNVGESVSGSFSLTRASGGAKNITLSELANPVVVAVESAATVTLKLRTSAGSDGGDDYDVQVDGMAVIQLPTNSAVVELNVSHVGASTAQKLWYFAAAVS